jgi:hypothetical protein
MAPTKRMPPLTAGPVGLSAKPKDPPRTRDFTIIAQDPAVKRNGRILTTRVQIPAEALAAGPWGHRVQVIDYDASTGEIYEPPEAVDRLNEAGAYVDLYEKTQHDAELTEDPHFHAQNVYSIVMRTLAHFEKALGRRVSWGFNGHQLKVVPHAFADANAFYSPQDEALVFGYFPDADGKMIHSCLSHDVVAHEATHALIDGLRHRFVRPSSPDQAGFHEGFADTVALLSVFSLQEILSSLLSNPRSAYSGSRDPAATGEENKNEIAINTIAKEAVTANALRDSALFGLAEQMGSAMSGVRGKALRRAADLTPSVTYLENPEFREPHRRGEILLAAMMNAFLEVWAGRMSGLGTVSAGRLDRSRVVEEGGAIADYLLTMAIRALDYTPPVDLRLSDFLSALLTADIEIRPDDTPYHFRKHLLESFTAYGIAPASTNAAQPGCWTPGVSNELTYTRTHFESMLRDPDEVYWFIWENRDALGVFADTYGHVLSVRPCLRIAPDGFALRETVVEFIQVLDLTAGELIHVRDRKLRDEPSVQKPPAMPDTTPVTLYGGNTLIFDEYGRLKYNVHNGINDAKRQSDRLAYLWEAGFFTEEGKQLERFSHMHLRRALDLATLRDRSEEW